MIELRSGDISISRREEGVGVDYLGEEFVAELGVGLPISATPLWTFDRSLRVADESQGEGRDRLGRYQYVALSYSAPSMLGEDIPVIQQQIRAYDHSTASGRLLVETRALEDIKGTYAGDSFYNTTFNSPVLLFEKELNFLGYTWGLMGAESSRDVGHFPEAITGKGIATLPSKLQMAGFSAREDLHTTSEKPFAPLVLYDDSGHTLVVSPLNHFLISPLNLVQTPSGMGIARGLHGSVDTIPRGTTTLTALVFGTGVVETMERWGDWLLSAGGKSREADVNSPLLGSVGFWNCFGGYYTELFRKVNEATLKDLGDYFRDADIPVGYFGLDLWYNYTQVGFARNYAPDAEKYPRELGPIHDETKLPYLLHMSAFESPNDYIGKYDFAVGQSSAYPMERRFYDDLAADFKESGAFGIWPDFLRTQLQNSAPLKSKIGDADRWFDDLAEAFGDQGLDVMMCMPTTGHYMASTRHDNVIAVRTHSDYLNHQRDQVESLRVSAQIRNYLPVQESIRHNVLVSFLGHCLGLCPSFDVFLTNKDHPEGFAEPNAEYEALLRAMSAGVVAIGDKAGFVDVEIVSKLCFPDGRIPRPDHPPVPVISSLQSDVLAFYTTTTVGDMRWVYLALFNVGGETSRYSLDIRELSGDEAPAVYDYFVAKVLRAPTVEGNLEPAQGHYYVIMPRAGDLHLLGFPDKYITVSGRQVTAVTTSQREVTASFRLPFAPPKSGEQVREYTVAAYNSGDGHVGSDLDVGATGAEIRGTRRRGDLLYIDFVPFSEEPSLTLRPRG